MYRINDTTFIDTSLITCAEYQLFIDEMRLQGKYFQPDHWKLYQFPNGQAHTPIFGVRSSDAFAFCDWLTKREDNEFNYRLPTIEEAFAYPLQSLAIAPSGYWTLSSDKLPTIVWKTSTGKTELVSPFPSIEFDRALKAIHASASELDHANVFADEKYRALERIRIRIGVRAFDRATIFGLYLDQALERILARDHDRAFDSDLCRVIDHARDRDLAFSYNRDFALSRVRDHALASAFDIDLALDRDRARVCGLALYRDLDRDLTRDLDIALVFALGLDDQIDFARDSLRNIALDNARHNPRHLSRHRASDLVRDLVIVRDLSLYRGFALDHGLVSDRIYQYPNLYHEVTDLIDVALNILILQLRRKNGLPIFEGIRIVRERKSELEK